MTQNDKPYCKESLECYLFIFIFMFLFVGILFICGQLTGTDWIAYFKNFSWDASIKGFKELFQSSK